MTLDPFTYFPGRWEFERTIRDHLSRQDGSAHGTAVFSREADEVRWRETGVLELGETRTRATRELVITRDPASESGWMVLFEDRRPFHPLILEAGEVEHLCRSDLYSGRVEPLTPDRFRTRWRVEGPGKNHEISTEYRRRS